jgi:rubredoxin
MSNDHPAAMAPEEADAAPADPVDAAVATDPSRPDGEPSADAGVNAASHPEPGAGGATAEAAPQPEDKGEAAVTAAASAAADDPDQHRFECRSCGFVFDPAEGIRKLDIPPGTPFSALDPVGFRCPVCRSRVGAFRDIGPRDKPSGFEENLNYGLGVNRLTPGQKNVLIFTGFALAIAFFLSLYSLR